MASGSSKIVKLELTALGSRPRSCPPQAQGAWNYLVGAHASVSGLFDTLHVLRLKSAEESDPRGRLSHDQTDQLRAALVFSSSGLDACLRRLLRDALPVLVDDNDDAEGKFKAFVNEQLNGTKAPKHIRSALIDRDPRSRLIEFYIDALTGSSLQQVSDLRKVRDALGIAPADIPDAAIGKLGPFFAARNEVAHELDLVDPSGKGTTTRRGRKMADVRDQCDEVLLQVREFIRRSAKLIQS